MSHTKEPWKFVGEENPLDHEMDFFITDAAGINQVCRVDLSEHNARRIVACVNACRGIPNEHLEADDVAFILVFNERNTLKQQRDELVAALERTLSWLTSYPGGGTMGPSGPYEQARAALAKVGAGDTAPEGHNEELRGRPIADGPA
ncbi:MAG: hypothetical protein KJ787_13990 [Gammaproteobacteria bacterium]|nr:hypothetical protein [Gammaproteobacteria bacterium]MBU1647438.1 hypothetical protein [Gammaproteobacteria bacterium]MBU1973230.1 hypothetical protein [Gammaproteobacteria bacterium]